MKKKPLLFLTLFIFSLLTFASCKKLEEVKPCYPISASFHVDVLNPNCSAVCGVSFEVSSTSLPESASYLWDFGDGSTSQEKNPIHYFRNTGTYQTKLTISELADCGISNTIEEEIVIREPLIGECVEFDPKSIQIKLVNGNYQIVDGAIMVKEFATLQEEALQTFSILQNYGITSICTIDDPNFEYALAQNNSPIGRMAGEDCIPFNPATVKVDFVSGSWKIVDTGQWIFDFEGNEVEARKALSVIKQYGFTKVCFVGRPHASFIYLRK